MVANIFQRATWTGTDAERLALTPDAVGTTFYCTDTEFSYWWDGASWNAIGGGVSSTIREVVFTSAGALAVAAGVSRVYDTMNVSFHVTKVLICVNTAPVGGSVTVDVHKNGVTIFTNQAHRPVITSGNYTGETTDIDVPDWGDDDYFTVDVDTIGAGANPGYDLTVHITLSQV